jgi:hypothetical protein
VGQVEVARSIDVVKRRPAVERDVRDGGSLRSEKASVGNYKASDRNRLVVNLWWPLLVRGRYRNRTALRK